MYTIRAPSPDEELQPAILLRVPSRDFVEFCGTAAATSVNRRLDARSTTKPSASMKPEIMLQPARWRQTAEKLLWRVIYSRMASRALSMLESSSCWTWASLYIEDCAGTWWPTARSPVSSEGGAVTTCQRAGSCSAELPRRRNLPSYLGAGSILCRLGQQLPYTLWREVVGAMDVRIQKSLKSAQCERGIR